MFNYEHDLQAELYKRLSLALEMTGQDKVTGVNPIIPGIKAQWNRISCEPFIGGYKPDIVIWDDLQANTINEPEKDKWPILFAFELKLYHATQNTCYTFEDMKDWYIKKNEEKPRDLTKLENLLGLYPRMNGCTISLSTIRADKNGKNRDCVPGKSIVGNRKIWQYFACLPIERE